MSRPARLETTSLWRIIPTAIWGFIAGASAVPVVNIPANDPGYFWRSALLHAVVGLLASLAIYAIQRAMKMNATTPAIVLSGLRSGTVVAFVQLLFGRAGLGGAVGGFLGGFLFLGMLFYGIERLLAMVMPANLGGNPSKAAEIEAPLEG